MNFINIGKKKEKGNTKDTVNTTLKSKKNCTRLSDVIGELRPKN